MRLFPLFAQCVMCYRTAEAQQGARARILNSGILILLIPPVLAMAGIIWFAWRRNKQQEQEKGVRSGDAERAPAFPAHQPRTQHPQAIAETIIET